MDLENEERTSKIAQWKKLRCCSICFCVTAFFLVITCAFTPLAMDALIGAGAKKSAALT